VGKECFQLSLPPDLRTECFNERSVCHEPSCAVLDSLATDPVFRMAVADEYKVSALLCRIIHFTCKTGNNHYPSKPEKKSS
jgi:hypothetical protein